MLECFFNRHGKSDALNFLRLYGDSQDPEITELCDNVRKNNRVTYFNYDFTKEYLAKQNVIEYDSKCCMFYTLYNGHRMYLKRSLNTREKCNAYLNNLFLEQDNRSPHLYLTEKFSINENDVVLDCGVAEGYFAIDALVKYKAKRCILVECDSEWQEALQFTFSEELKNGNVSLYEKYLGCHVNDSSVTIDKIYSENRDISFVKMDVEGHEQVSLIGGGGGI